MTERLLFSSLSGRVRPAMEYAAVDVPLIVAIHGGSYSSEYFDVPGYSLLDRADALGVPIVALDRPGYGHSTLLPGGEMDIQGQAAFLAVALEEAWARFGQGTRGMFIIGHSIGAAISASIAAMEHRLPLLGLALSGVGLRTPDHFRQAWDDLPDTPRVELPTPLKDDVMFGPAGSFDGIMPAASHPANTLAVRAELIDIVNGWPARASEVLGRIRVPVHYRQAEVDKLWIVDRGEVERFGQALVNAPGVDARLVAGTGHCMDFHRIGAALQVQQIAFALQCAAEKA